jgi:tetratricopeptide (TPR) repeat protein
LLATLLLRTAIVVGLAALIACQDDSGRLAEHEENARAYLAEEKWPEAIIEFRHVLRIDPNHAAGHYGLATAYFEERRFREAYWELQETIRLDPSNTDARVRFASFLLFGELEERQRAVTEMDAVLALEPERFDALLTKGRALESLDRPEEARESYEKAVEASPGELAPLLLIANFHRRRGEREVAEPYYRKLTEVKPGFSAYSALASFLAEDRTRDEEAGAVHQQALEHAEEGERVLAIQRLSAFYYDRGRVEGAEATLLEGVDATHGDLSLIYALARLYNAEGETARADEMIEEAALARPGDVRPYLILSAIRGRRGDAAGALDAAEKALAVDPVDADARLRKAELIVEEGLRDGDSLQVAKGQAIIHAILAKLDSHPPALFVRAKIEMSESRVEDAISTLRRVIDARPDWGEARFLLGSAMFAAADPFGARVELLGALEVDPSLVAARKLLAEIHASLGEHDRAIEEARRVLVQTPRDVSVRILVAQSMVRLGALEAARDELSLVAEEDRSAAVHFAIGRVHYLRRDFALARVHLEKATEEEPLNAQILAALLQLDSWQVRIEESLVRIRQAVRAEPESSPLVQLLGLAEFAAGNLEKAEVSFRRGIALDPNDLLAYQRLAQFLAQTGRIREVVTTYEKALAANPTSARLNLVVGVLHERLEHQQRAMDHYEEAIRLDPNLAAAKNNLAYLLAERGEDLDRALDLASDARSLLPQSASTADTLGWVLYKKQIAPAAVGYLLEAEDRLTGDNPSIGIVRQHLALAYEANGEPRRAVEVVDRALEDFAAALSSYRDSGVEIAEPEWASELRVLRARLQGLGGLDEETSLKPEPQPLASAERGG